MKEFEEVRVRTEVKRSLLLVILEVKVSSFGGEEQRDGGTALLVRVAGHQSLSGAGGGDR